MEETSGEMAVVTGWGQRFDNWMPDKLQEVRVPIVLDDGKTMKDERETKNIQLFVSQTARRSWRATASSTTAPSAPGRRAGARAT